MAAALAIISFLVLLIGVESNSGSQVQPESHKYKGPVKFKHCKASAPADEGWISRCEGVIQCPDSCPTCHLSCKYCAMIYCPRCNKVGSVCQDPRFIGGDGTTFYFHGHKDGDFCIVTDTNLHINAHFIGKRPQGRPRDFTWVQALGILFGSKKLYVGAKKVSTWDSSIDHINMFLDGESVSIPSQIGAEYRSPTEDLIIKRADAATNSLNIFIPNLLNATLHVVPISQEESRVHKYGITKDDCFAHLEINFQFLGLTDKVGGVLGQTYSPEWKSPAATNASMPTLGFKEDLFFASSVLTSDCSASRFQALRDPVSSNVLHSQQPRALCGKGPNGSGFTCRR